MRINIALPLPCSFKQELNKNIDPLNKYLYRDFPHCQWLNKEEWRVTLGFYGKLDNENDVGLVCTAVEQAVTGFGPIIGVTGRFGIMPDVEPCFQKRKIVGLTFEQGSDRIAELSGLIAEKMNSLLPQKYTHFTRPYITLARKGRERRSALLVNKTAKLEPVPLVCVFKKAAIYISDKQPSSNVYVLKKSAQLI